MISNPHLRSALSRWGLALGVLVLGLALPAPAQPAGPGEFARRAAEEYRLARAQYQAATNPAPAAWQFARAGFNFAEFATNDAARAALAIEGIAACRQLIQQQPKSAPAHYYLGMNLGQLARTELLGALDLVREMEREFKTAWSLDPHFDHAGAARSLGQLYRDSPGWPASIGDKHKAREWLERAARTAPDFPENLLLLSESYVQWRDPAAAREKLKELEQLWPRAQTNLTGRAWEPDWADWTARRSTAQAKISVGKPGPIH
jgi:tetratricopeptide (TPR) repeat protein